MSLLRGASPFKRSPARSCAVAAPRRGCIRQGVRLLTWAHTLAEGGLNATAESWDRGQSLHTVRPVRCSPGKGRGGAIQSGARRRRGCAGPRLVVALGSHDAPPPGKQKRLWAETRMLWKVAPPAPQPPRGRDGPVTLLLEEPRGRVASHQSSSSFPVAAGPLS